MSSDAGESPLAVYYSYAHQDEALRQALEAQLKPLERQGLIKGWHRGLILPGSDPEREVSQHLRSASLLLLLLSPDYVDSDACYAEMKAALARSQAGEALLIPILVRPVDVDVLPVRSLQALPRGGKAVTEWRPRDRAWQDIVRGIRRVLEGERTGPTLVSPAQTRLWTIPYGRNLLFTGREEILQALRTRLTAHQRASLTQPQAISGLGGVGKSQTAIEYAYRYREEYRYVLWINAATRETLATSLLELAALLRLPEQPEQAKMLAEVQDWFRTHEGWLVIFDNADDLALVEGSLPTGGKGHLLLTTRAQVPGVLAHRIEIEQLDEEAGMLFLLRRAGVLASDAPLADALEVDRAAARAIVQEMDGLPLALDQAGAYIEETSCSVASYLTSYQQRQAALLVRRGGTGGTGTQHPEPVSATWSLSFARVEALDPRAADLLQACAFLAPDAIPEQLLREGAVALGEHVQGFAEDAVLWDEAIGTLLRYSLVKRKRDEATLSVHRLVQAVLRASLEEETRREWAERVVRAVSRAFPHGWEYANWPRCQASLPHAEACFGLIEQWAFAFAEAALLCNAVGSYLQRRGQYPEAEAYFQRAIAIGEKTLGPEHPYLATYSNNLAGLYYTQGKYEEAEPLYWRALAIREQQVGPEHPDTAQSLNNLANLYYTQGKYEEAERFYRRAIAIDEQALGPEHPDLATDYNNLASLYYAQGKYEEAEPLFQRALAIREQQVGPEHPDTAQSLNNLANLYKAQGKYEEAEPLFRHAIAIGEQALGPEHPDLAARYNNLALLYKAQGKYEEAEPLYRRAIAIGEKTLGPEHPDLAIWYNNLANLYTDQGKYEEAERLYQRAIAIGEKTLGPEHPNLASYSSNLALLYKAQGKYAKAERLYQRALAIREQHFGPTHPFTVQVREDLQALQQSRRTP